MGNGHGGRRAGAGRPRKAEQYAPEIAAAERRIADKLPGLVDDLLKLAHGGFWEEEEERQPSAIVTVGSGEFEMPAFPDKRPDELVLVKRKRRRVAPDRAALTYLIDRILGKPTTHVEAEVEADGALTVRVVYDDDADLGGEAPEAA